MSLKTGFSKDSPVTLLYTNYATVVAQHAVVLKYMSYEINVLQCPQIFF